MASDDRLRGALFGMGSALLFGLSAPVAMLLGDRCTRRCGYCSVTTAKPLPPDGQEPARVAEAARRLRLR